MLRSSSPLPHNNNLNHHHREDYYNMPATQPLHTRSCSPLHFLNPGNFKSSPSSSSSSASSSHHHHHLSLLPSSHSLPSLKSCPSSSRTQKPRHRKMQHKAAFSSSSSANEDVSRLLDPSYQAHSSSSSYYNNQRRSPTTVTAYVDANGEVHDPDYRDFPVTSSASSSPTRTAYHHLHNNNNNQHRSMSSSSSPSNAQHQKRRRPQFDWEVELDESALDDEYAVASPSPKAGGGSSSSSYGAEDYYSHMSSAKHYQPRYVSTNTASWTSAPAPSGSGYTYAQYAEQAKQGAGYRPRDNSISTTATSHPSTTSTMYSPTGTASTLPTSYEDDEASPIGLVDAKKEEEKKEKEKVKARKLAKRNSEKERAMKAAEKERLRLAEEARLLAEKEKEAQRLREEEEEEEEMQNALQRRRRSTGSYDLEKRAVISHMSSSSHHGVSSVHVYVPARSSFSRTRGSRRTRIIDALEMEDALRHDMENERARKEEEEEEQMEKAKRRKSTDGRRVSGEYARGAVFEEEDEEERDDGEAEEAGVDESSHLRRRSLSIHLPRCPSARSKHNPKSSLHEKTAAEVGDEYVPTCTQSLRRQWQALALSVRFGVFRAQRRVMRRVASVVN